MHAEASQAARVRTRGSTRVQVVRRGEPELDLVQRAMPHVDRRMAAALRGAGVE